MFRTRLTFVLMILIFGLCDRGWGQQADAPQPIGTIWKSAKDVPVTGAFDKRLVSLDELMTTFLADNQIPGGTLAVANHGRVVYSRGFGYCDLENRTPMPEHSVMRIASISKPITAVAILCLVDRGKLDLDDKVFSILPHKKDADKRFADPRMADITVLHLLRHTAGFDRNVSFDPMFHDREIAKTLKVPVPVSPDDVVNYMLTQELDFAPGARYAYSNFGYCLLGRVIEQVSGERYERFLRKNVLDPLKLSTIAIGSSRFDERRKDEPIYYTRHGKTIPSLIDQFKVKVQHPYGRWDLKTLEAHGGLIASASDLVQFAMAFENPKRCEVLSRSSVAAMFHPPGLEDVQPSPTGNRRFYGCGWQMIVLPNNRFTHFHSGLFSGTSSQLVRRFDGITWAVIFNTDSTLDWKRPVSKLDSLMHRAVNAVQHWPR